MNQDIINILTQPLEHEWSVQGLGFMRTYLPAGGAYTNETQRLHIWHSSLAVHGATQRHDHPWNFISEVMFGSMSQARGSVNDHGMFSMRQRILCGEGGGIIGEPERVRLNMGMIETYVEGDSYRLEAHEVHNSFPMNNTVTVITREFLEDRDHAHIYYEVGGEFVSAAPRPASRAEILFVTRSVLHAYQETQYD